MGTKARLGVALPETVHLSDGTAQLAIIFIARHLQLESF